MSLFFKSSVVLLSLLFSNHLIAKEDRVIYGEDDRQDVFELDVLRNVELARSTAAMINSRSLRFDFINQTYSVANPTTLEKRSNVCPSVKFADQPAVSVCSGFLVADDILVTAGHCFDVAVVENACANYQWVFDYKMDTQQAINLESMDKNNVYSCSKVIKQAYNPRTGEDFAIIQLSRKVVGRTPLKINRDKSVNVGTDLMIIGNPWGLPTKISANAEVKGYSKMRPFNFEANLDSFQGNSGSAVLNAATGAVEGILVAGKIDAVPSIENDLQSCKVLNFCSDDGGKTCTENQRLNFELVTTISTILPYLP